MKLRYLRKMMDLKLFIGIIKLKNIKDMKNEHLMNLNIMKK